MAYLLTDVIITWLLCVTLLFCWDTTQKQGIRCHRLLSDVHGAHRYRRIACARFAKKFFFSSWTCGSLQWVRLRCPVTLTQNRNTLFVVLKVSLLSCTGIALILCVPSFLCWCTHYRTKCNSFELYICTEKADLLVVLIEMQVWCYGTRGIGEKNKGVAWECSEGCAA